MQLLYPDRGKQNVSELNWQKIFKPYGPNHSTKDVVAGEGGIAWVMNPLPKSEEMKMMKTKKKTKKKKKTTTKKTKTKKAKKTNSKKGEGEEKTKTKKK